MNFKEAAQNLNKRVRLNDKIHRFSGMFLLTGAVIRKNQNGVFMQAELSDPEHHSVIYAALESVEAIGGTEDD